MSPEDDLEEEAEEKKGGYTEVIKGHLKTVRDILFGPISFFEDKKDKEFGNLFGSGSLGYITCLALFYVIADGLLRLSVSSLAGEPVSSTSPLLTRGEYLPLFLASEWVLTVIGTFVAAAYIHPFTQIVGGGGNYWDTYHLTVFSSTPLLFLGWFPLIYSIAQLWSFLVLAAGIKCVHKISWIRSISALVILIIVPYILLLYTLAP